MAMKVFIASKDFVFSEGGMAGFGDSLLEHEMKSRAINAEGKYFSANKNFIT